MTDLEAYVAQPGRDDLVKQVREKINELGISYIYYQFISVTGRIVGKGIPADHWERTAERGFQLVYGSTANLFIDRHGDYMCSRGQITRLNREHDGARTCWRHAPQFNGAFITGIAE